MYRVLSITLRGTRPPWESPRWPAPDAYQLFAVLAGVLVTANSSLSAPRSLSTRPFASPSNTGSASLSRPVASATHVKVTLVLGPDGSKPHVVVSRAPEVAFQANRRLGSYSVTSLVALRWRNLPVVANVAPMHIGAATVRSILLKALPCFRRG